MFRARMNVVRFSPVNRTRTSRQGMNFSKFSILYDNFNRNACPRKVELLKPHSCEDCGLRFESERAKTNHQRNVRGEKKKRKTCSFCGRSVLSYNWKRQTDKCGHKCSKCDHISATESRLGRFFENAKSNNITDRTVLNAQSSLALIRIS